MQVIHDNNITICTALYFWFLLIMSPAEGLHFSALVICIYLFTSNCTFCIGVNDDMSTDNGEWSLLLCFPVNASGCGLCYTRAFGRQVLNVFLLLLYLVNGLHVNVVLCIHSSTDNRNRIGGPGKWLYSCQCRELEEQ